MQSRNVWIGIIFMVAPCGARAQWIHYPSASAPRSTDGKVNLTAAAPKGSDGKPDLSGIWAPESTPVPELLKLFPEGARGVPAPLGSEPITKYFAILLADFKPGEEPLRPGVKLRPDDPALQCLPRGMPLFDTYPLQRKIVQTPQLILMLSEDDNTFRQIFTDGRKLPDDLAPLWLGSSIGGWEGDTLVVETAGINARTPLDLVGHTHSEQLHITERFRRVNFGRMELQLTLDDPQTFTKPVTVKFAYVLLPDTDLIESYCAENEKDHLHVAAH